MVLKRIMSAIGGYFGVNVRDVSRLKHKQVEMLQQQ
jgi:hypothetical protein